MGVQRQSFLLAKVPSSAAAEAFLFHEAVSASDSHIWPRTDAEIQEYAESGCLFGVRQMDTGDFIGLIYAVLNEETATWEVGGLAVSDTVRGLGIGTLLMRFALAHTIVYEMPWHNGQDVIAHVHESNMAPRSILETVGFEHSKQIEISGDTAPASMKRNEAGNVVGDEFRFPRTGIQSLSAWFNEQFDGTIGSGTAAVEFDLGPSSIENLKEALREMA